MANFELRFLCLSEDNSYATVKMYQDKDFDVDDMIEIVIVDPLDKSHSIIFDKSTAIKFAKTLRTEINKIQEGGEYGKR